MKNIQWKTITFKKEFTREKQKPYNPRKIQWNMLSDEQAKLIKDQLLKQLQNFPADKQELIKSRVLSMSTKELEEFITENELVYNQNKKENPVMAECIFCNIASKRVKSFILDENNENLAVLELNPLSKGHLLVIPKKHLESQHIPSSAFGMAKRLAKRIKTKFKPKEIKISIQKILNHSLIEVTPLYGNETERRKASEKELIEIQEILKEQPRKQKVKKQKINDTPKEVKIENEGLPIIRPRIP